MPNISPLRLTQLAHVLSEVFGPAPALTFVLLQTGIVAGGSLGALQGFVAALLIAIGPYAALLVLARRGRVSGRFVADRKQRAPILAAVLVSVAIGIACMFLWRAPVELTTVSIAAAIGLIVTMVANLFWKLSIHSAIVAYAWVAQLQYFPAWAVVVLAIVPVAVGWARVEVRAHTRAQVLAGFLAGLGVYGLSLPVGTLLAS